MNEERLVSKLHMHWSYGITCIYCFVGILASMYYFVRMFSESAEASDFNIAIILFITSLIAGVYIKIIDDAD